MEIKSRDLLWFFALVLAAWIIGLAMGATAPPTESGDTFNAAENATAFHADVEDAGERYTIVKEDGDCYRLNGWYSDHELEYHVNIEEEGTKVSC